jgi:hypothetical protein
MVGTRCIAWTAAPAVERTYCDYLQNRKIPRQFSHVERIVCCALGYAAEQTVPAQ